MIIGFVGKNAAGKTVACKHLESQGFTYYSLSDVLRELATKQGLDHERETLIKFGTEMREKNGVGYLAAAVNEQLPPTDDRKIVIDSIRSPGEIEELQQNSDFHLIGLEADAQLRFDRMQARGRTGDAKTFEEFQTQEAAENTDNKNAQQLDKCLGMSEIIAQNNGKIEELYAIVDDMVKAFE